MKINDNKMREIDMILRDLILWNNKYNHKGYLSITIGEFDITNKDNMIMVNNDYWNVNDGEMHSFDHVCYASTLINGI